MSLKGFLPLLALAGAGWGWQHKTESEFRDALAGNEVSLVAFVAPSTDACKSLEPEWAAIEDAIPVAMSVDCVASPSLCADHDVSSFPAIRLYHADGTKNRYRGPRKATEIANFAQRMLRPPVARVDKTNLSAFRASDNVVFIAHMSPSETSLRSRFADLAERFQDRYTFGMTEIPEPPGRIACYNNANGAMSMTSELEEVDAMEKLVRKCAAPLIPRLTRSNEAEYLSAGKSLVYFFAAVGQYLDAWEDAIKPLARKYHEYITFATVDLTEYPDMPPLFGLPEGAEDGVALLNPSTGQKFPFKGEITADAVEQFIVDISEGNIEAWDPNVVVEEAQEAADRQEVQEETEGEQKEATQADTQAEAEEATKKARKEKVEGHDEL